MKNKTITIMVSEGEQYLNIDGHRELLKALVAVLRGERDSAPADALASLPVFDGRESKQRESVAHDNN